MESRFLRQQGLISPKRLRDLNVVVIGVGGLGSFAAFALAKMGVGRLTLYDDDKVELHNVANQLYQESDIGNYKVDAMQRIISTFAPITIVTPVSEKVATVSEITDLRDVIVSTVDSMKARTTIWQRVQDLAPPLFIDVRAGAEDLRFLSIMPMVDGRRYAETLYTDGDALEMPCTARAIIYTGFAAGAYVAAIVKRFLKNELPMFDDIALHVPTLQALRVSDNATTEGG